VSLMKGLKTANKDQHIVFVSHNSKPPLLVVK
jgi:hypothetical protein